MIRWVLSAGVVITAAFGLFIYVSGLHNQLAVQRQLVKQKQQTITQLQSDLASRKATHAKLSAQQKTIAVKARTAKRRVKRAKVEPLPDAIRQALKAVADD